MRKINNNKYVIAKSVGPNICLTIGKVYEVLYISSRDRDTYGNHRWVNNEYVYNPNHTSFYIVIKGDDNGIPRSIWNDYFYSTEQMRELIIDGILK